MMKVSIYWYTKTELVFIENCDQEEDWTVD